MMRRKSCGSCRQRWPCDALLSDSAIMEYPVHGIWGDIDVNGENIWRTATFSGGGVRVSSPFLYVLIAQRHFGAWESHIALYTTYRMRDCRKRRMDIPCNTRTFYFKQFMIESNMFGQTFKRRHAHTQRSLLDFENNQCKI